MPESCCREFTAAWASDLDSDLIPASTIIAPKMAFGLPPALAEDVLDPAGLAVTRAFLLGCFGVDGGDTSRSPLTWSHSSSWELPRLAGIFEWVS